MIISIRGTSGSGKTTVVRRLERYYPERVDVRDPDDARATGLLGHVLLREGSSPLRLVGRYNVPSGGCDKIYQREKIFDVINGGVALDQNVLFEGVVVSNEVGRTVALSRKTPVHVIFLDTPLDACLAAINARRRAKNPDAEPVNPKNTAQKHAELVRIRGRLKDAAKATENLHVHYLSREDAYRKCCELLGLEPEPYSTKEGTP